MKTATIRTIAAVTASVSLFAACSSSSAPTKITNAKTTSTTVKPGGFVRPKCVAQPTGRVAAKQTAPGSSDYDITSFDGTTIRAHWFPRALDGTDSPTILKGPGWGTGGDTNTSTTTAGIFSDSSISRLHDAGYNVLTWDPRGWGASSGTITINSPDFEGRDVQRLIDWVATLPAVKLDGSGDPRMGMVGGSYGGGIQLITAALDCRVDVIVPTIAWHSLITSLYKGETFKQGWGDQLYSFAPKDHLDPHITSAYNAGHATGVMTPADQQWFAARGPADLVGQINVPTLFIQGTVDTLFSLDEAVTNYRILRTKGVEASMIWYCGGHGSCLTHADDGARIAKAAELWLARSLKDDANIKLGPRIDIIDQQGKSFTADDFPTAPGAVVKAHGNGTLKLVEAGGAGPATTSLTKGLLGSVSLAITPGKATNAVSVSIPFSSDALVAAAPKLKVSYTGTAPAGPHPTRVFAQLVDDATGIVLGNQITPIVMILDGAAHTATVSLETISYHATPGAKVTLQIVATTVAYAQPRLGGSITFSAIDVELPTSHGFTAHG